MDRCALPDRDELEREDGAGERRADVVADLVRVAVLDELVRRVGVAARRTLGAFRRTGLGGGVRRLMALRR